MPTFTDSDTISLSISTLLFALLDLVTEQFSTDNAQALASLSLAAVMHLKTFQVHSDDLDNVNDNIYLNRSVAVLPTLFRLICKTSCHVHDQ